MVDYIKEFGDKIIYIATYVVFKVEKLDDKESAKASTFRKYHYCPVSKLTTSKRIN